MSAADHLDHAVAHVQQDHDPQRPPIAGRDVGEVLRQIIIIVAIRGLGTSLRRIGRSEEHTSELQSLMRISYAVFCLNKQQYPENTSNKRTTITRTRQHKQR